MADFDIEDLLDEGAWNRDTQIDLLLQFIEEIGYNKDLKRFLRNQILDEEGLVIEFGGDDATD